MIETEEALEALVSRLAKSPLFSFRVEIDLKIRFRGTIVGLALCTQTGGGDYVPVGHQGLLGNGQLDEKTVLSRLRPILENGDIAKTAYNLKHQTLVLRDHGVLLRGGVLDPMVMSYVLNPSRHGHGLGRPGQGVFAVSGEG